MIVTGANSGLGLDVAKQLVQLDVSKLIFGCRNLTKGEAAKTEVLRKAKPNTVIEVWQLDMADFNSVKAFAERASRELPRLDALLANAAVSTSTFSLVEGFEQSLTVNVLSTFLLSILCMPLLMRTASETGQSTHLTITGSETHAFADHKQLQHCPKGQVFESLSNEKTAEMSNRYFLSKLIVMLCAQEMAAVGASKSASMQPSVVLNCANPGWCRTALHREDDNGFIGRSMIKLIGRSGEEGARVLVATLAADESTNGKYFTAGRAKPPSVWVRSQEGQLMQKQVWDELVAVLKDVSSDVAAFAS